LVKYWDQYTEMHGQQNVKYQKSPSSLQGEPPLASDLYCDEKQWLSGDQLYRRFDLILAT